MELQEKLLEPQNHGLKPDEEFLGAFAGVVGSKWPSLATTLSLSESEIVRVRCSGHCQGNSRFSRPHAKQLKLVAHGKNQNFLIIVIIEFRVQ